jgi:CHAT domain-containing protein/tetratricopeptide (TPR) repeat protein
MRVPPLILIIIPACIVCSLLNMSVHIAHAAASPYENAAPRILARIDENNRRAMEFRDRDIFLDAAKIFEASLGTLDDLEKNLCLEPSLKSRVDTMKFYDLYWAARCYSDASLPDESLSLYRKAGDFALKRRNVRGEILSLHGEALVHLACGESSQAMRCLMEAERLGFEFLKSPARPTADLLKNVDYYAIGNELRKIRISMAALLFSTGKSEQLIAMEDDASFMSLDQELLDMSHAEEEIIAARSPGHESSIDPGIWWLLWDIIQTGDEYGYRLNLLAGMSLRGMGDKRSSMDHLNRAMDYAQFGSHKALTIMGDFLRNCPIPLESTISQKSRCALKAASDLRLSRQIEVGFQMARSDDNEKASMEAIEANEKRCRSLTYCREPWLIVNDSLKAAAFLKSGAKEKALSLAEAVLSGTQGNEWFPFPFQVHLRPAEVLDACDKSVAALETYDRARSRVHPVIPLYCQNESPLEYLGDIKRCSAGKIRLQEHQGKAAEALASLEDLKNTGLALLCGLTPLQKALKADDRAEFRIIRSRIYNLSRKMENISAVAIPDSQSTLDGLARDLRRERECLTALAATQTEDFSFLLRGKSFALEEIQKSLSHDCVMLYYFYESRPGRESDHSMLWAVTDDSLACFALPVGGRDLQSKIGILNRRIEEHSSLTGPLSSELYNDLIHPARQILQGKRTVVIVPYGHLHYLPFGMLTDREDHMLLERFNTVLVPSGTILRLALARRASGRGCAVIVPGGPQNLPINSSALALQKAYGFSPLSFSTFMDGEMRGGQEVLHLQEPLRFTSLSPLEYGKSGLTFERMAGFYLTSSLIFAENCTFDMSGHYDGIELEAFYGALLLAGNRSLIVSLGEAPQSSRDEFVSSFYAELQRCHRPEEALRKTQVIIRKKHPLPCNWAPYVLYGL